MDLTNKEVVVAFVRVVLPLTVRLPFIKLVALDDVATKYEASMNDVKCPAPETSSA